MGKYHYRCRPDTSYRRQGSLWTGVPHFKIGKNKILAGEFRLADMLTAPYSDVFPSKSEFRKIATAGGLSINKRKVTDASINVTEDMLVNDKYIIVQKGKKNYYLFTVE